MTKYWYYIKKGALDWSYTGVCAYYGTNYYIIKGALNWGYNGTITWNGKKHSVVWGVVK